MSTRILRDVLNCHVTNIYGAREVGHIAMRCPEGNFHINEENLLVEEEEPSNGKESAGELLVTTLDATIMPFLRYRMGDLGRLARKECTCGRSLLLLEELVGRTGEIFRTRDGRMISPNFWCRTFMNPALSGKIAFVYPGSGNYYAGMGREFALRWPEVVDGEGFQ